MFRKAFPGERLLFLREGKDRVLWGEKQQLGGDVLSPERAEGNDVACGFEEEGG